MHDKLFGGSSKAGKGGKTANAGKKTKGRKRHILVDTLGIVIAVLVTSAGVQAPEAHTA